MARRSRRFVSGVCESDFTSTSLPALIERWRGGDDDIVGVLWARCQAKLSHSLTRRFRSLLAPDECEEIASLTFARASARRSNFTAEKGAFEGWLWKIAYHLAAEEVRRHWLKERLNETALPPEKLMLFTGRFVAEVKQAHDPDASKRLSTVTLALQSLPERQRAVLWADACSPSGTAPSAALAQELNVKPSTIRSLRHRARAALKTELTRLGFQLRNTAGGGNGFDLAPIAAPSRFAPAWNAATRRA